MPTMYPQQLTSGTALASEPSHNAISASIDPEPQPKAGRKRKRYYEDSSDEEDEDAEVDPESYYQSVYHNKWRK